MATEKIVSICSFMGHDGHSLMALTSSGRIFERVTNNRDFQGNGKRSYLWNEIKGPEQLDLPDAMKG
jgi:hypothetical protein